MDHIIHLVIQKLEFYIDAINPQKTIYISFDGTPPLAKIVHQRERRYKSSIMNEINRKIEHKNNEEVFDTIHITSGTQFMNKLDFVLKEHFKKNNRIIFSGSQEPGEGENKIFQHIRNNFDKLIDDNIFIFGLDADLFILSLNHIELNNRIFLLREKQHMMDLVEKNNTNTNTNTNTLCMIDIHLLADSIAQEMCINTKETQKDKQNIIKDYIFLTFFLGNDFLKNHISLNIRTGGHDKIINAYKNTFGSSSTNYLTNKDKIVWKNVFKFLKVLSDKEETYLHTEMKLRNKKENYYYDISKPEKLVEKFENIPSINREMEKYIHPCKDFWKERYYSVLFHVDIHDEKCKKICLNYLESLEWTFKYYSLKCPDFRWYYKYDYSPLLCDLVKYIPIFEMEFFSETKNNPLNSFVQLLYVLPKKYLNLFPEEFRNKLILEHPEWYSDNCEFIWCFKKYLWESAIVLPELNIYEIENFVNNNISLLNM
jgi:5'-3' exonuclease